MAYKEKFKSNKIVLCKSLTALDEKTQVYSTTVPLRNAVSKADWPHICNNNSLDDMMVNIDAVAEKTQDGYMLVKFYFYFDKWGSEELKHRLICTNPENLETDILAHLPYVLNDGIDVNFLLDYLYNSDNEEEYADEYGYRRSYAYE